jgi:predicted phage terminase large subunit-like protein
MSFYGDCMLHKVKPLIAAIEKKSTGVTLCSVLQDMRGLSIREVKRTKASGSKTDRYLEMQPIIASKLVSFTKGAKHTDTFINHMMKITANDTHRHDDLCDTMYDAIKLTLIDKTLNISQNQDGSHIVKSMAQEMNNRFAARTRAYGNQNGWLHR